MMIYLVCGGRDYDDVAKLDATLDINMRPSPEGARGYVRHDF